MSPPKAKMQIYIICGGLKDESFLCYPSCKGLFTWSSGTCWEVNNYPVWIWFSVKSRLSICVESLLESFHPSIGNPGKLHWMQATKSLNVPYKHLWLWVGQSLLPGLQIYLCWSGERAVQLKFQQDLTLLGFFQVLEKQLSAPLIF